VILFLKDAVVFAFETVILPLFLRFKDDVVVAFNVVWGFIRDVLIPGFLALKDNVVTTFTTVRDTINDVKDKFDTFKTKIGNAVDDIKGFFNDLLSPIKKVFDKIKDLIDLIPNIKFPKLPSFNLPLFTANGGIFDTPQARIIAEAGREAVIPLTNPFQALRLLKQSGLDKLVLKNASLKGGATAGNTATTGPVNTTSTVNNNITVLTRPGQDERNISKSLLNELALI
jgi:hypothetical protein